MKEKYDVDKLLHIGLSAIFIVVFCPDHKYSEAFGTYCQTIWLMILFSLPGLCLYKKECFCINLIITTFLGIVFYLMLFEARARYLICFVPILILASVIGIVRYAELFQSSIKRIKR